jgi:hypothetical protein
MKLQNSNAMKKSRILFLTLAFVLAICGAFTSVTGPQQGWAFPGGLLPGEALYLPILIPVDTEFHPCWVQPGTMCKAIYPLQPGFNLIRDVYQTKEAAQAQDPSALLRYN